MRALLSLFSWKLRDSRDVMRVFIITFVLFIWPMGSPSAQPLSFQTQDPQAGSRVFGSKGCIHCHSISGVGGDIGPDLGRVDRPRSFYDLAAAMWNHLPGMVERMRSLGVSRTRLSPQETADLVAFLFSLNYFDEPGDLEKGKRLFVEKKCIVCHQIGGMGGVVGPNLDSLGHYASPIYVAAAMWNHAPAMIKTMRSRGIKRPVFRPGELRNLMAYLRSVASGVSQDPLYVIPGKIDQGKRLFVEKRCSECHRVRGRGGRIGPELGEQVRPRSLFEFASLMWNKAPSMISVMERRGIPIPKIRVDEMADIVAYLTSVQYFEAGDPNRGRGLLSDKQCLSCHSLEGIGGSIAGDLARTKGLDSPATALSALWNHSLISQSRLKPLWSKWPQFSAQEMADLLAFLQTVGQNP